MIFDYIRHGSPLGWKNGFQVYAVDRFTEKPDPARAEEMTASGNYSWNSGMFICRAARMLEEFERQMADFYGQLMEVKNSLGTPAYQTVIDSCWPRIAKQTIDYGVMEKAGQVVVIPVEIGWTDIGSWGSLFGFLPADDHENVLVGDHLDIDTQRTLVFGKKRLVATLGVKDLIIIDTEDAMTEWRTFHDSLRFPWPRQPVQVVLKRRSDSGAFDQSWSTLIDPSSRFVNTAAAPPRGRVWTLFEHGPAAEKVDLLIVGEGYTEAQLPKFHADASRLVEALFAQEPFKSRRADFNVRGLDLPSDQPGVSRPQAGSPRRTPLSAEYNIFDSERYLLTRDNRALRDAASAAPYEFLEILVNEEQYGGGGIFGSHATAAADNPSAEYLSPAHGARGATRSGPGGHGRRTRGTAAGAYRRPGGVPHRPQPDR